MVIIYTPQYLHFRLRAVLFQKSNHHVYVHQAHRIFEINLSSISSLKYQINNTISEALPENNTSYFKNFVRKTTLLFMMKIHEYFNMFEPNGKNCARK